MRIFHSRSSRIGGPECALHLPLFPLDGIQSRPASSARPRLWSFLLRRNREDPGRKLSIPFLFLQPRQDICSFQTRLFQDAVECAGSEIVTGVAGDRDAARFGRMFELSMAAACRNQVPPVPLEHLDYFPNFHVGIIT